MEKITLKMILSWNPPACLEETNIYELNAYIDAADTAIHGCEHAAMYALGRSTFLDAKGANHARECATEADNLIVEIKAIREKIKKCLMEGKCIT